MPENDDVDETPHMKAMLSTADFWRESMLKYMRNSNNTSLPKGFPCRGSDEIEFWQEGKAVYKYGV